MVLLLAIFHASAQESVVLRTDRDLYIAGEPVWLTVSCFKSGTSDPSGLSKVVYVEVLNGSNEPVSQIKLFLETGTVTTRFILPDSVSTGNYLVRAYTKWLRNYNPELYFSKNIVIINPFSRNPFPQAEYVFHSDTVFFFPEGGNVLAGRKNRFLIKSFDHSGQPKAVSGQIVSPSGNTRQQIECNEKGVLALSIPVVEKGNYRFVFEGREESGQIAFHTTENISTIFLTEENKERLVFEVNLNKSTNEKWKLDIITASGAWLKSYEIPGTANSQIKVSAAVLPSGYLCALLTDEKGNVQASRYFIVSEKLNEESIQIDFSPKEISKRSEIKLNIEKPDDLSNVSVAVVKESLLNRQSKLSFASSPVEIPLEYFTQASAQISPNDLLIPYQPVTSIRSENKNLFLPERKGEIISGTVVNLKTQEPIRNEAFMLSFVGKYPTLDFYKTDDKGRFYFEANRYGEQEIVIQPFKHDSLIEHYKVNLDLPYCSRYTVKSMAPLFIDQAHISKINEAVVNMQINLLFEAYNPFSAAQIQHVNPPAFYGTPNSSTTLDDYIELPTMEEIIREIVPQTSLVKKDDKFSISIAEGEQASSREINSFCLIDGVPVKNQEKILEMNAERVERIDVENRDVFVKNYKIGKVFSLITKEGDMGAFDFDKRIFRQSFQSYQPEFDFNSPDYTQADLKASRLPDFRNVLYWNPNITFNDQNRSEVKFFTSDENAVYKIVVEGINSAGMIEHKEISLEVKDKI